MQGPLGWCYSGGYLRLGWCRRLKTPLQRGERVRRRQRVNGATHDFLKSRSRPPWLPNRLLLAMTQLRRDSGRANPACCPGNKAVRHHSGGMSARHVMITAWLARARMLESVLVVWNQWGLW
jgi:hypothetical protein